MINWLDKFIKRWDSSVPEYTGANLHTQEDLNNAIKFSDIVVSAAPVASWPVLNLQKLPTWVQYNQGQINKCVASTKALMDSIKFYKRNKLAREVKFSDDWVYKHRVPVVPGMVGTRAIDVTKQFGCLHSELFPLVTTDAEVDAAQLDTWMRTEAALYVTADDAILPPIKDIDILVSIMMITDKPIMVWFEFAYAEWTSVPFVSGSVPNIRHSVTFIPPKNPGDMSWGMYEGEKAIVIQDSWGLQYGINGKRIIKESFFKARNIFCQYDMRFKFDVSSSNVRYDGTIVSLQKCLQSVGYFPTNIAFVESFGPTTKSSLMKWKASVGLSTDSILDDVTKSLLMVKFP